MFRYSFGYSLGTFILQPQIKLKNPIIVVFFRQKIIGIGLINNFNLKH